MMHVVAGCTDAAGMLLFDPRALPVDFDRDVQDDPCELLEREMEAGNASWVQTDGDGAYLLHVYVDEQIPDRLRPYLQDEKIVPAFHVPSGTLYFTGVEYGFRDDDSFLRKHPHMGEACAVPPGRYRLTLCRAEYPDGLEEAELEAAVTPSEYRLHHLMGGLVLLAVLGVISLISLLFNASRLQFVLPLGVLLCMAPILLSRLPAYRRFCEKRCEVERRHPSLVARLETMGS